MECNNTNFDELFAEGGQAPKNRFVVRRSRGRSSTAQKNNRPAYVLESLGGYEIPEPVIGSFETREVAPVAA